MVNLSKQATDQTEHLNKRDEQTSLKLSKYVLGKGQIMILASIAQKQIFMYSFT